MKYEVDIYLYADEKSEYRLPVKVRAAIIGKREFFKNTNMGIG